MRLVLAAALLAATPLTAHDYQAGTLSVGHPIIFEGPPTLRTAAGYMTVTNQGEAPDQLIGVRVAEGSASVHETRQEGGVARMLAVDTVEIPAGGEVAFEAGGLHVMFTGIGGAALREGATLPATLVFEEAGEVEVVFNVEARPAAAHEGHGSDGH